MPIVCVAYRLVVWCKIPVHRRFCVHEVDVLDVGLELALLECEAFRILHADANQGVGSERWDYYVVHRRSTMWFP